MEFKRIITCWLIVICISAFTPSILTINHRIRQLEERNSYLSSLRNASSSLTLPTSPIITPNLPKYSSSQIKFTSKCNLTGPNYSSFLFQTLTNVYFAVNHPHSNSLHFYNHLCHPLSSIDNLQIREILCDRGVCQSGTLHFLAKDNCLYSSSEDKNFSSITHLSNLQSANIIGGVIRNRGKDKIQIYLASQEGVIRVLDESGVAKLRMEVEGFNAKIHSVQDHHPYPIIVMQSNWISMLDTTKYSQLAPNCPHIPNIKYILAQNYYGEAIYVLTSNKIYLVDFQLSKKNCIIKRQYDLETPIQDVKSVSFFSNIIFMDNKVYNLTEKKLYVMDDMCLVDASLTFLQKKSHPDQIYALKQCCNHHQCNIQLFDIKKVNQDRSILFWLTIAFIAVLFLSISFMKKSNINNLDLDDPSKMREREVQQQIMALTQYARTSKDKKDVPISKSTKKQS